MTNAKRNNSRTQSAVVTAVKQSKLNKDLAMTSAERQTCRRPYTDIWIVQGGPLGQLDKQWGTGGDPQ